MIVIDVNLLIYAVNEDSPDHVVDAWLQQPSVTVPQPTARHLQTMRDLISPLGTGGDLTSDPMLQLWPLSMAPSSARQTTISEDSIDSAGAIHLPAEVLDLIAPGSAQVGPVPRKSRQFVASPPQVRQTKRVPVIQTPRANLRPLPALDPRSHDAPVYAFAIPTPVLPGYAADWTLWVAERPGEAGSTRMLLGVPARHTQRVAG